MGAIYKNGILYSGGGGSGESIIYLTKAEYDALDPPVEGQLYGITDWSGDAVELIDDTTTAVNKTWSSSKIGGELQGKNLLDNPWFTVNQRGFSTTTTRVDTYGFDRWRGTYRYDSTNKCSAFSNVEYIIQCLDEDLKKNLDGKTVTASILYADGTIKKGTVTYRYPYTDWQTIITDTDLYCQIGYSSTSSDLLNGAFTITAKNASFSVKAVKLEVGSGSTLANDIVPDYAIELAKCKASSVDPNDTYANQGQIVTVEQQKKNGAYNLCPNNATSQVINAVTFTVNSDGSILANGTASGDITFTLAENIHLSKSKYVLVGGNNASQFLYLGYADGSWHAVTQTNSSGSANFEISAGRNDFVAGIFISSGQVVNFEFRPMITTDLNATYADYVPYAPTNREILRLLSNPNLLDNPWFMVNQRGSATYSGFGYTVDRWARGAGDVSGHTLTLGDSTGTQVTLTEVKGDLYQPLDSHTTYLLSRPYTISAYIDGVLYQHTFTPIADGQTHQIMPYIGVDNLQWNIIENWNANAHLVGINNFASTTDHYITKIKLELGTFSTLYMDNTPNYQQELAKCQRYFLRVVNNCVALNGNGDYDDSFFHEMRANVAFSNGSVSVWNDGWTPVTPLEFDVENVSGKNFVRQLIRLGTSHAYSDILVNYDISADL